MSLQVSCVPWWSITCGWVTSQVPGSLFCSDPLCFPCVLSQEWFDGRGHFLRVLCFIVMVWLTDTKALLPARGSVVPRLPSRAANLRQWRWDIPLWSSYLWCPYRGAEAAGGEGHSHGLGFPGRLEGLPQTQCWGCMKAMGETREMQSSVQGEVGWLEGQQGWDGTSSLALQWGMVKGGGVVAGLLPAQVPLGDQGPWTPPGTVSWSASGCLRARKEKGGCAAHQHYW